VSGYVSFSDSVAERAGDMWFCNAGDAVEAYARWLLAGSWSEVHNVLSDLMMGDLVVKVDRV
jgi:hypothetical protein